MLKSITASEVQKQLEEGKEVKIIDVRGTDEVVRGKIPGAQNIPLHLLDFRMNELDKKDEYIIVCHSGGRSAQATMFLDSHGYNVINMNGGMLSWQGNVE